VRRGRFRRREEVQTEESAAKRFADRADMGRSNAAPVPENPRVDGLEGRAT
jgi:hypothetical protein